MPRTHKTLPRLFVAQLLSLGVTLDLSAEHANYLLNVLRRRVGDSVVLFNGRDGAWRAEIANAGKKTAQLTVHEQSSKQAPASDLWYGFAPLKSARLDYMIQKATEMGVGLMQPVLTQHTQNPRLKTEKLQAHAIEAAEQCEVLSVPHIQKEIKLVALVQTWTAEHADRILIVADEDAASDTPVQTLEKLKGKRIGLLIGPEGGFSDEERTLLHKQSFVVPISLGPRILRADTAAVAALAVIQSIIGDWR
jgi:16S rRNA (uracil1498-N3)-methyltransferase